MRLLHPEIDIEPGRKAQKEPVAEGRVGKGMAVLRITNNTDQENAYVIRLQCDQPYWQNDWYQLTPQPPSSGVDNAAPVGKPDQAGPKNQTLRIYVSRSGTRDVAIYFNVPDKPESRAGVYNFKVIIETKIAGTDASGHPKQRFTEVPGTAIVRPFYRWEVNVSPEDARVNLFKRRADYDVTVVNQGNDWLYFELAEPRAATALINRFTTTLAIPPPEPGMQSFRTVPIRAITRIRRVRGSREQTPLPLSLKRIDAPTVPPLSEEAVDGLGGANTGASVVATQTSDIAPSEPRTLTYCTLTESCIAVFLTGCVMNLRNVVLTALGLVIAWTFVWILIDLWLKSDGLDVPRSIPQAPAVVELKGRWLASCSFSYRILTNDPNTAQEHPTKLAVWCMGDPVQREDRWWAQIPRNAKDHWIQVIVQRGKFIPWIKSLGWVEDACNIMVGKPPEPTAPLPPGATPSGAAQGKIKTDGAGDKRVAITGQDGKSPGDGAATHGDKGTSDHDQVPGPETDPSPWGQFIRWYNNYPPTDSELPAPPMPAKDTDEGRALHYLAMAIAGKKTQDETVTPEMTKSPDEIVSAALYVVSHRSIGRNEKEKSKDQRDAEAILAKAKAKARKDPQLYLRVWVILWIGADSFTYPTGAPDWLTKAKPKDIKEGTPEYVAVTQAGQ